VVDAPQRALAAGAFRLLGTFLPRFDPSIDVAPFEVPGAANPHHGQLAAMDDIPKRGICESDFRRGALRAY
jgi:hypothetical protein